MDNRFILLSGMGWSGSSAVIDLLVQNNIVSGINNYYPNETAFFNTFFSPLELIEKTRSFETISLEKILCLLTGGKIHREFINYELFKVLTKINPEIRLINEFPTDGIGRNKDNIFNNSQINWFRTNFERYIKEDYPYNNKDAQMRQYIELITEFLMYSSTLKNSMLLLDQDPHYYSYFSGLSNKLFAKLFSMSIRLVIIRNPYDIFYESILALDTSSINNFKFYFKKNRIIFSILKGYITLFLISIRDYNNINFLILSFEELLSNEGDSINYLKNAINYENDLNLNGNIFDLNRSKKNIGISKGRLNRLLFPILYFNNFIFILLCHFNNKRNKLLFKSK